MIEVRVGRWQDTLPGTYDPDIAVVVTDPPYGLAAGGGLGVRSPGSHMGLGRKGGATLNMTEKGYADEIPWSRHVEEVLDVLPAKRHCIRGPATMLSRRDHRMPRRVCIEVAAYRRRAANRPGVVPFLWQGWAIYGRLKVERHGRAPIGDAFTSNLLLQRDPRQAGPKTDHRALTPFPAAAWIVDTWVDPGCIVIDPFAGLGTIGLAARLHGFDYVGSELVPEYAAVANKAFESEAMTLDWDAA